ncbi:unnamed protein product [Allacma fusca]|uniref:Complex 1 LYR protein domain-containing protein n=1 Tax=Allacma fusca TaxID=39272 RepID=A0A8J2J4W7_9HEXA|nr:unnamed protein product [Allacma fusca]
MSLIRDNGKYRIGLFDIRLYPLLSSMSRNLEVLRLYKNLMRESQKFESYNFRSYAIRRIRDAFKANKSEVDVDVINAQVKDGLASLDVIRRQVIVSQLYQSPKSKFPNNNSLEIKTMDEVTADTDGVISYMRQLIENYEDLVRDMSETLKKNHEEFELIEKQVSSSVTECENCHTANKIIENLRTQLENLSKAKILTTSLWHSSVEQIEQLENRLKQKAEVPAVQLKTSSDTQNKFLQTYISRLEGRLEQASQEKNFYRRKLMETKLENEANLKNAALDRQKAVEVVKSSYTTEIQHLKQTLEKERQMYQSSLEKKLEDERKNWARDEQERKEHLKTKWLAQIQPLITEQESLLLRESQLCEKLHETQSELFQLKQILTYSQGPFLPDLSPIRPKVPQTARESPPEKQDHGALKKCDHEECVKYNMHEKVLHENERLGEEISRLRKSNQSLESEHLKNAHRLELRIHDLESLNAKLQSKLLDLNPKDNQNDNCEKSAVTKRRDTGTSSSSGRKSKETKRVNEDDPILTLADEFSQLCNLSFEEKFSDPVKRIETEARVQHLERYAKELQFRHHLDKQRWYLREQSFKAQIGLRDNDVVN